MLQKGALALKLVEASSPVAGPAIRSQSTLTQVVTVIWALAGVMVTVGVIWMMQNSLPWQSLPFIVSTTFSGAIRSSSTIREQQCAQSEQPDHTGKVGSRWMRMKWMKDMKEL
jgi:hypothetical protein